MRMRQSGDRDGRKKQMVVSREAGCFKNRVDESIDQ